MTRPRWAMPRTHFYPRPPRGGRRLGADLEEYNLDIFLSTPSARRATQKFTDVHTEIEDFYPRPPRGGRRVFSHVLSLRQKISIHALREEGDVASKKPPFGGWKISIHALREEGDVRAGIAFQLAAAFLSTPSARRATDVSGNVHRLLWHFYPRPRGGRRTAFIFHQPPFHFYPRHPRGGRPRTDTLSPPPQYFYPRPPRGGRHQAAFRSAQL